MANKSLIDAKQTNWTFFDVKIYLKNNPEQIGI